MQTSFSKKQLRDKATATSESVIRKCVHCGFCTATCPTYVLLGDELDSPRGRIYMIKDMLENERTPSAETVKHVDRCLSCLSCMSTCPSGVNYMHLVDHARSYIDSHYKRPIVDRMYRFLLATILPYPARARTALAAARLARPLRNLFGRFQLLKPMAAMLALAPSGAPGRKNSRPAAVGSGRPRVAVLQGCVEPVMRPEYQDAAYRVLARAGFEPVAVPGEQCCGALVHHMGKDDKALAAARQNVTAWSRYMDEHGLHAIIVTASGCGTTLKDYAHMLRDDPDYTNKAARVSSMTKDICEFLSQQELPASEAPDVKVAYHAACSLQHGQQVKDAPKDLLENAGYTVAVPAESHLCCGSAGVYNILQPDIASQLGDRKAANLDRIEPDIIATGNVGCAVQLGSRASRPVVHTIELLDWAQGGPRPTGLDRH